MIKAVIFDLDDTLISERQYIESGYRHISKMLSNKLKKNEEDIYLFLFELLNLSSKNVFNRLFESYGISYTKEDIMELVLEYRNHQPQIKLFNDVLPCINELKSKGIKLGVITDGYGNAQRRKLGAIKAIEYFNEVIVTDELGKEYWKPHPRAFEIMKEKLNVEFNEMIYVGDNPEKDFYISEILPIRTVRVYRSVGIYTEKAYYKNLKENFSVFSLSELNKLL